MNSKIIFCDYGNVLDIKRRMKIYKKCGVKSISPLWGIGFGQSEQHRFNVFNSAKSHGISIDIVHFDYDKNDLLWTIDNADEILETMFNRIKECSRYGIKAFVYHAVHSNTVPLTKIGITRIKQLVKACEENNVIIAIENTFDTMHVETIFNEIKSPNMKMLLDTGHANLYRENFWDYYKRFHSHIAYTHLNNNHGLQKDNSNYDEHFPINKGTIDFKRFFEIPNNIEYHAIEVYPYNVHTEQEFEDYVNHNMKLLRGFRFE